jgi:hypothetical protein
VPAPRGDAGRKSGRVHVRERKIALALLQRETFIPQSYAWGGEAQVDWYEAYADICGEREQAYVFCMCSMASGAAFHCVFPHASQQAFLEAHERVFLYFGGVFAVLRYDNLKSAVKKILLVIHLSLSLLLRPSGRTLIENSSLSVNTVFPSITPPSVGSLRRCKMNRPGSASRRRDKNQKPAESCFIASNSSTDGAIMHKSALRPRLSSLYRKDCRACLQNLC